MKEEWFENKVDKTKTKYKTFWKDKEGNELTRKEFMGRWKQGIMNITPLQQTKAAYNSTWIMIIGVVIGIVIAIINLKELYWLVILLFGSLGVILVQQIGTWQKKKTLESFEQIGKEVEE